MHGTQIHKYIHRWSLKHDVHNGVKFQWYIHKLRMTVIHWQWIKASSVKIVMCNVRIIFSSIKAGHVRTASAIERRRPICNVFSRWLKLPSSNLLIVHRTYTELRYNYLYKKTHWNGRGVRMAALFAMGDSRGKLQRPRDDQRSHPDDLSVSVPLLTPGLIVLW